MKDETPERHFTCPVHGSIACSEFEARVIDTPPFQRLRRIKQLGNSQFVFPGATHTRFSHSLGVMHLAGTLFDALLAQGTDATRGLVDARSRLRTRVRLAGLLHDVGHGPYSHHFENLLVKWSAGTHRPLLYSEWRAPELRTPEQWLKPEAREAFGRDALAHEHFTYGIIRVLEEHLSDARFDAQGICSLLDERIAPSPSLADDLAVVASHFAGEEGVREAASLRKCLKSILSSEIDADRMDYLQRDSLSCGVRLGLDLRHLFASASLQWDAQLARFVILVKPNAVGVIEQILIARKQMFDQVYQHRVTVAFDALLTEAMHYWMRVSGARPPTTLRAFLDLTDDALDEELGKLVGDVRVVGETRERLALKMFVTRTTPVREDERVVSASDAAQLKADLEALHARRHGGKRAGPASDILDISLKEFFRTDRESLDSRGDVLFVSRSRSTQGAAYEAPGTPIPPTPLRLYSEVLQSTAWRNSRVRVTVYRPREESALARGLGAKLTFFVGGSQADRKEDGPVKAKKASGLRKALKARYALARRPREA